MALEAHYARLLRALEQQGRLREPGQDVRRSTALAAAERLGHRLLDASSNDYLGLAARPVSRETSSSAGAGASRLIHGGRSEHRSLEAELAAWVETPNALLFSSGFAANVGVIPALAGDDAVIVSDALNHASIVDGCRLSRARRVVVPHLDLGAIERALGEAVESVRWVVTESYFSMDGDSPNLPALRALCDRHGAGLYVDEAHALGVFGPSGAGKCREAGIHADVLVGTLGKAVGVQGAFVASSPTLRGWLWNRARSFVYTTAPSPELARLVSEHLRLVQRADAQRQYLAAGSRMVRDLLAANGVHARGHGPILPLVLGTEVAAMRIAEHLMMEHGILVQAIRPPTVPPGTSRLRVTVTAAMQDSDWDRLGHALALAVRGST